MDDRIALPQVVRLDCWVGDDSWDVVDLTESRRLAPEEKQVGVPANKSITLYRIDKKGNLLKSIDKSRLLMQRKATNKKKKKKITSKDIWSIPYGWFYQPGEKIPLIFE
uniref:Uncharacterized protein n=1 Tax=Rhodnius prolixus TaxID=13249 RepID=T1I342_RHOPR